MKKLLASSMGSNEKVNSNKLFCTLKISKDLIEYVQKKIKFFCPSLDRCRVSYLVGHHHTYDQIDGLDYQILVEADFLVNLYEDGVTKEAVMHAYNKIFRTEHGKRICAEMFGIEE